MRLPRAEAEGLRELSPLRDSLLLPSVCRNFTSFLFAMAFFNFLLPLFIIFTSYRLMEQKLGRTRPPQVRPNPAAEDSALLGDVADAMGFLCFQQSEAMQLSQGRARAPLLWVLGIGRHDLGERPGVLRLTGWTLSLESRGPARLCPHCYGSFFSGT